MTGNLWAYAPGAFENMKAVVYDFCESRAGEHARAFLGEWRGSLTCDDFSGYKALIASGVTEVAVAQRQLLNDGHRCRGCVGHGANAFKVGHYFFTKARCLRQPRKPRTADNSPSAHGASTGMATAPAPAGPAANAKGSLMRPGVASESPTPLSVMV